MNEGIRITIEPMTPGVKGLAPRLKYPVRQICSSEARGKTLREICTPKPLPDRRDYDKNQEGKKTNG